MHAVIKYKFPPRFAVLPLERVRTLCSSHN